MSVCPKSKAYKHSVYFSAPQSYYLGYNTLVSVFFNILRHNEIAYYFIFIEYLL